MKSSSPPLDSFAEEFRQEILLEADTEGDETFPAHVLTRRGIETLIEVGEVENAVDCYLKQRSRGIEVSGYGIDDGDTLNLVVSIHRGEVPPSSVTRTDIKTAFKRGLAFWQKCQAGPLHDHLEESSDGWSMAQHVHELAPNIRRINLFLVTDGLAAIQFVEPEELDGVEVRRSVWDIGRFHRLDKTGERGEPIEIDFVERFGRPLPCLPADLGEADYASFLSAIPGDWLASIYDEFGARLLEKNVRSFLQFTGKVNRGMRDTLRGDDAPRFFAYNNGISATASSVELGRDESGGMAILKLRDLQIVNGGQTTASIHRSQRDKVDMKRVAVQAKITEVEGSHLEEMVPLISRYANSQNKVSLADLSSNDPFHIELETLSRSVWAPATSKTTRQTRWFYERARGQYADAMGREPTRARQRIFKEINPRSQKITKTDMAKFENTWSQRPWEVSTGAQKNFTGFMVGLPKGFKADASYFQRLVAKGILFRRAEQIVSAQKFGGYRANIVTYSLAKLSYATQQRLDLGRIWESQKLSDATEQSIEALAHMSFRVLTEENSGRNVTEWAKREDCWKLLRQKTWDLPADLESELIELGPRRNSDETVGETINQRDPLVEEIESVPGDAFLAIANWAKQTDNLTPWQRKFAFTVGRRLNQEKGVTAKQAPHAKEVLAAASELGFDALSAASSRSQD